MDLALFRHSIDHVAVTPRVGPPGAALRFSCVLCSPFIPPLPASPLSSPVAGKGEEAGKIRPLSHQPPPTVPSPSTQPPHLCFNHALHAGECVVCWVNRIKVWSGAAWEPIKAHAADGGSITWPLFTGKCRSHDFASVCTLTPASLTRARARTPTSFVRAFRAFTHSLSHAFVRTF